MNAIVVVDQNWAIGRKNGLLFSLPGDMKRFRLLTTGGTLILGRRTLDSFPGGRPLPGRRNIVITRNAAFSREGCQCVHTPEEALAAAGDMPADKLWLIGGESVYAALLSQCRRAYVTKVEAQAEEPDAFFPNLDTLPGWTVEHEGEPMTENGLTYRFVEYINKTI